MVKTAPIPDLKRYLDKRLYLVLNGGRKVVGILRGFDPFMNMVMEEVIEHVSETEKNQIGSVVIRGNSIIVVEALERILNQ
jgi:small nuclear ribonucleoprotein G